MLRGLFIGVDKHPAPITRLTCARAESEGFEVLPIAGGGELLGVGPFGCRCVESASPCQDRSEAFRFAEHNVVAGIDAHHRVNTAQCVDAVVMSARRQGSIF